MLISKVGYESWREIQDEYDYIFLDLPPSMALVPENSWRASDYLLVPISDNFALNGTE